MRIAPLFPTIWLAATLLPAACSRNPVANTAPPPTAPESALRHGRAALESGRIQEAAAVLDAFLESAPPGRARNEALELGAVARLSGDPAVRDLERARALLAARKDSLPPPARPFELAATMALVDEAVRLRQELAQSRDAADAERQASDERFAGTARELRQVRAENVTLRNDVKELRDELKKKGEALQKIAATLVSRKPGRQ